MRTRGGIREPALVILVALNACFLPWAYGGVDVWSQGTSAGLAVAAFCIALLPRPATSATGSPVPGPWQRLRAFPAFWAGLAVLGYVAVQALNPSFQYLEDAQGWWLRRVDHVAWLPSGMTVPFSDMSPWRAMVVGGGSWLTLCALHIGVTRRSSLGTLLVIVVTNAFLFAVFGILQKASGTHEVYGTRVVEFHYFFGAIIYKNHAAAYLSLTAFLAIALTLHAFRRSAGGKRSGPGVLFLLFAVVLIAGLVLTYSFSGLALFTAALAAALVLALLRWRTRSGGSLALRPFLIFAAVLVAGSAGIGSAVGHGEIRRKVHELFAGEGAHSTRTRALAAQAGWAMFQDEWLYGWGAGCFRYGFTKYQHAVPELTQWRYLKLRWEHVHNDWLETAIELGVVGLLPLLFLGFHGLRESVRLGLWRDPMLPPILCGLVALLTHGTFDFPLQNPAVLVTAAVAAAFALRWSELSRQARHEAAPV